MVINGLTKEIAQLPELMDVSMNNFPSLIIKSVKHGRVSRYKAKDVYVLRDCCVMVNGVGNATCGLYIGKTDPFYPYYHAPYMKPEKSEASALREVIGEYLTSMGYSLAIVPMGMVITENDNQAD